MRNVMLSVVVLALLGFSPAGAHAAPGDLDTGFGTGGFVTTDFGGTEDGVRDATVDSTERVVVVGGSETGADGPYVVRYTAAGALDPTFGSGGVVRFHFGPTSVEDAAALVIDGSGRIVVAGRSQFTPGCSSCVFAVARLTSGGQLDPTFGGDGTVTTNVCCGASTVAIDGNGRIVVGGGEAVLRLTDSGTLDPNFSGDGVATEGYDGELLALDGAGRIMGGTGLAIGVDRLLDAGELDTSFGVNGFAYTHIEPNSLDYPIPNAMAVDAQNRVLIAGITYESETGTRQLVVRFTASGTLDSSFDGDGILLGDTGSSASDVAVDANGRVLVVGWWPGTGSTTILTRYLPDGSLDPSFGAGAGFVAVPFLSGRIVTTDSEGRIVVAGIEYVSNSDIAVARYLDTGEPTPRPPPPASTGSSLESPPTTTLPAPSKSPPATKPKKCKKGFRKKRVHGKVRCVKTGSGRRKSHRH